MTKRSGREMDVNLEIANKGFGSSSTKFNLLEAIVHEAFLHAESSTLDFMDDGAQNNSNLPKRFCTFGKHADHYHITQGAIYDNDNPSVKNFTVNGFNILKQAATNWQLNFSDKSIRTYMWNFSGSLVNVNPKTGKLEYDSKQ